MVEEYTERCYLPSQRRFARLSADHLHAASELAEWRRKLGAPWPGVRVDGVENPPVDPLQVGADLPVSSCATGQHLAQDVEVQVCYGLVDNLGEIMSPNVVPLESDGGRLDGLFEGRVPCQASGQHGYTVRVLPRHANLANPFEPGLVAGDEEELSLRAFAEFDRVFEVRDRDLCPSATTQQQMRCPLTRVPFVLPRSRTRTSPSVRTKTQCNFETLL